MIYEYTDEQLIQLLLDKFISQAGAEELLYENRYTLKGMYARYQLKSLVNELGRRCLLSDSDKEDLEDFFKVSEFFSKETSRDNIMLDDFYYYDIPPMPNNFISKMHSVSFYNKKERHYTTYFWLEICGAIDPNDLKRLIEMGAITEDINFRVVKIKED